MSDAIAVKILVVLVLLGVVAAAWLYSRRQAIASAADKVVIDGSAGIVKGSRAARAGWDRFRDRVLEKAGK